MIFSLKSDSEIFLTFDDGPCAEVTPQVLTILNKYEAKATFFCIGKNVKNNRGLYNEIISEGHSVGNHTFNHLNGWKTKKKDYLNDVNMASEVIDSDLFRPPYGRISVSQYLALKNNFRIIFWNVLTKDYSKKLNSDEVLKRTTKRLNPGSIVVFHDSIKASGNLLKVLPLVIEEIKNKNLYLKSIPLF